MKYAELLQFFFLSRGELCLWSVKMFNLCPITILLLFFIFVANWHHYSKSFALMWFIFKSNQYNNNITYMKLSKFVVIIIKIIHFILNLWSVEVMEAMFDMELVLFFCFFGIMLCWWPYPTEIYIIYIIIKTETFTVIINESFDLFDIWRNFFCQLRGL